MRSGNVLGSEARVKRAGESLQAFGITAFTHTDERNSGGDETKYHSGGGYADKNSGSENLV